MFLVALLIYLRGRTMFGYLVARWSLRARSSGNVTASLATLEYREMLRLLERRGWKKSPSQTALEFAAAIPAAEIAAPVAQLTAALPIRPLRRPPAPAQQMSALLSAIREFTPRSQGSRALNGPVLRTPKAKVRPVMIELCVSQHAKGPL